MNRNEDSPTIREVATQSVAASRYDDCHPADSFSDLVQRARFSKEGRGLMEDWLAVAERLMKADVRVG